MKHLTPLLLLLVVILAGCKGDPIDISKLVAERDSLKEASARNKENLDELNFFIDELATSLDSIAMQEGAITLGSKEGTTMSRAEMKQSLNDLSDLLTRQRQHIASLQDSLKAKSALGSNAAGLKSIIENLQQQLEEKEQIIAQLQAELNSSKANVAQLQSRVSALHNDVSQLTQKNEMQKEALQIQTEIINEGYVKIASKKDLKKLGVLNGGFLKKKKLNATGLNPDNFTKVNITTFTEITIQSSKPKILTSMPTSSYTLRKNADGTSTLTILDPTSFWRASNYLVISTD